MNQPNRRDKWKVRVQRDRNLSGQARLFLVATLAPKMKSDGKVSQPRKKLAAAAGVSERMVTKYITQAKEAGWLVVVQPGYRSMTAVYQASFPDPKEGTNEFPLYQGQNEPERGNYKDPHCAGTDEFPHSPEERGNYRVPTTSSSTTRRLSVVGTDRNVSHLPKSPQTRRRAFSMNERNATARTNCRTQPKPVERHRTHGLVTAPVERHPSGCDPATRFVCPSTRPRRKAHR